MEIAHGKALHMMPASVAVCASRGWAIGVAVLKASSKRCNFREGMSDGRCQTCASSIGELTLVHRSNRVASSASLLLKAFLLQCLFWLVMCLV
jgi:hypothetical protein